MLIQLTLQHLALVERAELELHAGFNVITGETGAGKSLLLDALQLCVGGRADGGLIRHGQTQAEVYAEFDIRDLPQVQAWLNEQSHPLEDTLLIRRQLTDNQGSIRSKIWLNGTPTSLNELKTLGSMLVNIHSQHAQQSLLRPGFITEWLDSATGLTSHAHAVRMAFLSYEKLKNTAHRHAQESLLREQKIQNLTSRLDDIEPIIGLDYAQIEAEYDELSNLESLIEQASTAVNLLDNDNDEPDIIGLLAKVIKLCEAQTSLSQTYADCVEQLYEAQTLLQEVSSTLNRYAEDQSLNPERLAELDGQLSTFHRLARKHQISPEQLLDTATQWQIQLEELMSVASPEALAQQIDTAYQHYLALATEQDTLRQQYAPALIAVLLKRLKTLSLPNVQAVFSFTKLSKPTADGISQIELLFSANVGMPMQPLHKIASGGELSRLALVMQVIDAQGSCRQPIGKKLDKALAKTLEKSPNKNKKPTLMSTQTPVPSTKQLLVFDEVDVGISGATAQVVGELLRELGNQQQILAITHQAQVASQAHQHILVHKTQHDQAQTHLAIITDEAQVQELARMSGGINITQATLDHAKSLLANVSHH